MNAPEGLPPLAARKGRLYDTGAAKWYHGTPMDLAENRACICWLLGPCPSCGSITTNYGSAYSCVNRYCANNAVNFATVPMDSTPDWWETEVNVFLDGNAWCATKDGFTNLQESPAGFGASPKEAVANLLEAVRAEPAQPKCKTCNDEGTVPAMVETATGFAACPYLGEPCRDCAEPELSATLSEPQIESSPTPETDKHTGLGFVACELISTSRRLERERDALKAERHELSRINGKAIADLARDRQELKAENGRLRKLVLAIEPETYGGIYAKDVDEKNWFDARAEALAGKQTP